MPLLPLMYFGSGSINEQRCDEPKCRHQFTGIKEAEEHMRTVHGISDGWKCSKCHVEFDQGNRVAQHFPRCSGPPVAAPVVEKPHKCMHCDRSFDTPNGLGQHMKKTHPVEFDACAPALKKNRVTSELIDLIAQAEASIPAQKVDPKRLNLDILAALQKLYPDVAATVDRDRIQYIRARSKQHKVAYEERVSHHRLLADNVQTWARGLPPPRRQRLGAPRTVSPLVTVPDTSSNPPSPIQHTPPEPLVLPQDDSTPDGSSERTPPHSSQPPSEVAAVSNMGDEPEETPPSPPGGDSGGDPPSPSSPASSSEDAQDGPLMEAIKGKLRDILRNRTASPLVLDINTVIQECLLVETWNEDAKQHVFHRLEEVLKKHRPKYWEEREQERVRPRREAEPPFLRNRAARRKHRYAKAQRLFKSKPKELMRPDILSEGQQEEAYSPTPEEAYETYKGRFGVPSKEEESEATPVGNEDLDLIWAPLSKKDVESALRTMPNSSAGPVYSKFNKAALKSLGSQALHRIFLIWQLICDVPDWCKENRTILIPKKPVPRSINDYRPLTIGAHLSRLYTRALAGRLTQHLPLHPRQKAFRPVDGCGENLALLEGVIADARKRNNTLYITFVDVAKAFDTVSHHSIERALRRLRCPTPFVNLVRNLYKGARTRIHLNGESPEPIHITNGVKQGCPLSPLLFNSVTDELLHLLGNEGGYRLPNGDLIASMAFADDLILISSSREGMVRSLRTMDLFFQARGMKVQPPKCCTIGLEKRRGGGLKSDLRPFSLIDPTTGERSNMRVMGPDAWTKYLGLEVSCAGLKSGRQLREEGITSLKQTLAHLHRLPLKANQKVHLLRTYVIPGLQYKWTKGPAALNMLREADRIIAAKVRAWLKVFPSTPMAFFRVPSSDGGLGIPSVQDLVTTGKARLHAKLCGSADSAVAYVAKNLLWGKEVRHYSRRLGGFQLGGSEDGANLSRKVREGHRRALQTSTHGRGAETFRDDPLGNSVINDVNTKTGLVIDMVKLRTQSFPVRIAVGPTQRGNQVPYNTTCRVPECTRDESLSHVLQECPAVHGLRVKRHEVVDQQCTKWITDKGFRTLKEPHVVSRVDGNIYKPDRFFCEPGSDTLYVVDWTVPYETTRDAMKSAERAKELKYSPHKASLLLKAQEAFPDKVFSTVTVKGVAFGARGAILPATREFLHKKLKMSKRCISWVQHRVAQKSIGMVKCFFAGNRG